MPQYENISHGRFQLRQAFQSGADNPLDYSVTRFNTSGSIERLQGGDWSFEWSGDARLRAGDAYRDHSDYQAIKPNVYRAVFQHPLENEGFLRFGRFLPRELPGIGYLDGVQRETHREGPWRFGVVAGLKPDRIRLAASGDEPTIASYATVEAGQ
ncbi:MAG: hypothetical protein GY809_16035, partial [Planctomycetes bacterium]|nr:hypothetical protein [Planctomycetota bacterium]